MATDRAPIALFAFRRPEHLLRCLTSLRANTEASSTPVWIFSDGPRGESDVKLVEEVRRVAHLTQGFASVRVIEQPTNMGLAASVISGVSEILRHFDRVIVIEDDLVLSPDFLGFMNQGLDLYAESSTVASIHGFTYAVKSPLPQSFFLRGADCWGWATWRRGWEVFNPDGRALLDELDHRELGSVFDFDGAYPFRRMLVDQVAGRVDSWAIRWNASAFLAGMLTLYPGVSLVENIGQDGSGTHSIESSSHNSRVGRMQFPLNRIPEIESAEARAAVARVLGDSHGSAISSRIRRILRKLLP